MIVTFHIEYFAGNGEVLFIEGNIPELTHVAMQPAESGVWHADVDIDPCHSDFSYRYTLHKADGTTRHEWGPDRERNFNLHIDKVTVHDRWHDLPSDSPAYSSAFTRCIMSRDTSDCRQPIAPRSVRIELEAAVIPPDKVIAVSGSCEALGNWNPAMAKIMDYSTFPTWSLTIPIDQMPREWEYKFIILDKEGHTPVKWEQGANRRFVRNDDSATIVISGLHFTDPGSKWLGAGVAIPVFSIRTEEDSGAGDFLSLIKIIDWAASTGQHFVQILPINDTSMTLTSSDSYPYNAISTFALHPIYLRPEAMGLLDSPEMERFKQLSGELNALPQMDYERVLRAKLEYTRLLFDRQGRKELESDSFKSFYNRNEKWLKPYAAFCLLRDLNGTSDITAWGEFAKYSPEKTERLTASHSDDINYCYYLQYHLDRQLRHVHDYGHSRGVVIKGDIPIGISRNSVDAWLYPGLFNLDSSAGAPPDDFSVLGQNWGFPTYNWQAMSLDGFAWWKSRFRKMSEYFDAYRIDHLLGFFRIWQIPRHSVRGLLGTFYPALPLTPEEIESVYGIAFDPARHTAPYITDDVLSDMFGDIASEVSRTYLSPSGNGLYTLLPQYSTQRRIEAHFHTLPDTCDNRRLRDSLYSLTENVLFIEDPVEKGRYHPRISPHSTPSYLALPDGQKHCFDRLHEDFFYHRHNEFWRESALWKLPPLIESTSMLVCAEDLGMIPACVPDVMSRLHLLSLEVQRMPKEFGMPFGNPARYPYLSVCTTSTHDMGGLRLWWQENPALMQRFYTEMLGMNGDAPDTATADICRRIIAMHLDSPSMLCILPLQDWLSMSDTLRNPDPESEQINDPSNPHHYWRYRMHIPIERIMSDTGFCSVVSSMIKEASR